MRDDIADTRQWLPLEDCMEAILDYRGKTPKKTSSGVPLVTAKIVKNGRILTAEEFIAHEDYDGWMTRGLPAVGDVVMTTEAPLGEVAQLDNSKVALAQRVITLRGKRELLDNLFLKYLLQSPEVSEQIQARASGTTVMGIRQAELRRVLLPLPRLDVQAQIAALLGTLDAKMEANRLVCKRADDLAASLFKSWFVDFDATQAKRDATLPFAVPQAGVEMFPSDFEDSAVGMIPRGWRATPLDSVADFLNGIPLQKHPPEAGLDLPVIKIAQLRAGSTEGAERASAELPPEYIIHDGDVIFSWSGSLLVDVWCGGLGALNQHLFKVTSRTYPKWFYFHWIREHLPEFQSIAADKATTMGHIRRHHLTDAKVVVPDAKLLAALTEIQEPLLAQLVANRLEIRSLAALRDTLLPALLSGEITLKNAEKIVGKAV